MLTPYSFLKAISEGTDVSAGDKATIDAQIKNRQIKVYIYNSQNSTPDVAAQVKAARDAGIPVTTVTETLAPGGRHLPAVAGDRVAGHPARARPGDRQMTIARPPLRPGRLCALAPRHPGASTPRRLDTPAPRLLDRPGREAVQAPAATWGLTS
jgi:hypothetical protein